MKIREIYMDDSDGDYRDHIKVCIDGKSVFEMGRGEPEDMSLHGDMNDACCVTDLLVRAYNAGKNGEPLDVKKDDTKSWDEYYAYPN